MEAKMASREIKESADKQKSIKSKKMPAPKKSRLRIRKLKIMKKKENQ